MMLQLLDAKKQVTWECVEVMTIAPKDRKNANTISHRSDQNARVPILRRSIFTCAVVTQQIDREHCQEMTGQRRIQELDTFLREKDSINN